MKTLSLVKERGTQKHSNRLGPNKFKCYTLYRVQNSTYIILFLAAIVHQYLIHTRLLFMSYHRILGLHHPLPLS